MSGTRCAVADQFCTGKTPYTCGTCRESVCGGCSVPAGKAATPRTCHTCLRRTGKERIADAHLRELGGKPRVAAEKPWRPIKQ